MAKKTIKLVTTVIPKKINHLVFFGGLVIAATGVFLLLSLLTANLTLSPELAGQECITGLCGAWLSYYSVITIGWIAAYVLTALMFLWGAQIMRRNFFWATWVSVLGGVFIVSAISLLSGCLFGKDDFLWSGLLCRVIMPYAALYFGSAGVVLAVGLLAFIGMLIAFGGYVIDLCSAITNRSGRAISATANLAWRFGELAKPRVVTALVDFRNPLAPSAENYRRPEFVRDESVNDKTPPTAPAEVESNENDNTDILATLNAATKNENNVVENKVAEIESQNNVVEIENKIIAETETQNDDDEIKNESDDENIATVNAEIINEKFSATKNDNFNEAEDSAETDENADETETIAAVHAIVSAKNAARANPYEKSAPAPIIKSAPKKDYELPSLFMLDTPPPPLTTDNNQLEKRAAQLIKTLNHFKIQGQVVGIQRGPRITQFEINIAAGIQVSKIRNLADNIAMDLKAMSVRIIAPIPGRDTIGIEIPNVEQELVALRDIVATVNREKRKQQLPLCLAKDVSGAAIVADLGKMPHLMIAGSTGSGKSVCINSIIMSFLMCMTPDECKLIMVDPKVVELSRFHDIPHLMSPVITDMQKAVGVLEWACQEMDERYEKLSMVSVNNLAKFNALSPDEIRTRVTNRYGEEGLDDFPMALPFIVIIIDELADLMMVAKKEVEHHIARLAAKSRAVGIHLILATQRPSTDVITGLIKANMPSRIAFQVSSKIDSRIILDQSGADALLGQGDMLYLPPGASKIQRAQGVFVSDEELFKVVDFCKSQREPEYHASLEGNVIGVSRGVFDASKVDELFFQAGEAIITEQRGSVSLLQRKFGVGYGRAARIIDQLAEAGVLGEFKGAGKPREILLEIDDFCAQFGDANDNNGGGKIAGLRDDEKEWE